MKLDFPQKQSVAALNTALDHIDRAPEEALSALLNVMEQLGSGGRCRAVRNALRRARETPDSPVRNFVMNALTDIDPRILRLFLNNLIIRGGLTGYARRRDRGEKLDCRIPWIVLMTPTSACNLHCAGCRADNYGRASSLPYEVMDRVVREGKELGIHVYLFSGGEPLIRRDAVLRLCRAHQDCFFLACTNGTLVTQSFVLAMKQAGNLILAFSVVGFERETDMRRGKGAYRKILEAMDLLKTARVPFGISARYHARNAEVVGSEAYMDFLIGKGARFACYFPDTSGRDTPSEPPASQEQRAFMRRQARRFRSSRPVFSLDIRNEREAAGGWRCLRINANGEIEPRSPLFHGAGVNIRATALPEALQSPPIRQPRRLFPSTPPRPCPPQDAPRAQPPEDSHAAHHSQSLRAPVLAAEPSCPDHMAVAFSPSQSPASFAHAPGNR